MQDPLVGALVSGRYRIQRRLGEGGMGVVYLARHEAIEKRVAIKILKAEYSQRSEIVARFQQEAKSASRVKHPNIVDVFDFGQIEDGRFFLALEYLEGRDLAQEMSRMGRRMPAPRALELVTQVCSALAAAHAKGVVHRDMKPENIFLEGETVKIVDFGIAKMREIGEGFEEAPTERGQDGEPPRRLTKAGTVFGTPEYIAPEQAAAREIDGRVDVYAVGCILYELLTGRVPFVGDSLVHTLMMQLTEPVPAMREVYPALAISPELESAVMRALEKQPSARWANMEEFEDALLATPEGQQVPFRGRSDRRSRGAGGSIPPPASMPPPGDEAPMPLVSIPARARTMDPERARMTDRSSTMPELPEPRSRGGSRTGVVVGALAGGVVLALIGMVTMKRMGLASTDGAPTATPTMPTATPTAPPAPTAPTTPTASSPTVTVQSQVVLHVVTDPPGAIVKKGGFQVCDQSPCDVLAQPNEATDLSAEKGDARGRAKVLAQREQTVTIKLAKGPAAPPPPGPGKGAAGGRSVAPVPMCEVMEGDLKILRPCK